MTDAEVFKMTFLFSEYFQFEWFADYTVQEENKLGSRLE